MSTISKNTLDFLNNVQHIGTMQIQITRASIFTSTNKRVKALAKELKLTLPECWDKLLNFGEDAIKRQNVLLKSAEAPEAESMGVGQLPHSTATDPKNN